MMTRMITINEKKYEFIRDYKTNEQLRNSFNSLTQKVYGFDFEQWFKLGYWGEKYKPYSLMKDNKVIANVSINIIDFSILGKTKRYVQIGTVMTDEPYRNLGLSKRLIELILEEWEPNCDLIYLFANDSVLEFYPKFGFVPIREYAYSKSSPFNGRMKDIRKLDLSTESDRKFLYDMVDHTTVLSKVSMLNNADLVLFYCTSFMSDYVFYVDDYNAIVIVEFDEGICHLHDVFCKYDISLDDIIASIVKEDTVKVILGFTPNQPSVYNIDLLANNIDVLFVKPDMSELFKVNQLRFPILSHA